MISHRLYILQYRIDNLRHRTCQRLIHRYNLSLNDKKDADKVKAIILLSKGWAYSQIEEALLLDEWTIHRYRNKYLSGGIDELLDNKYKGGFCRLTSKEKKQLAEEPNRTIYSNAATVCNFIRKKFNKKYSPQGGVPLLHSLGFSYKNKPIIIIHFNKSSSVTP